jgi:hypothetical protein
MAWPTIDVHASINAIPATVNELFRTPFSCIATPFHPGIRRSSDCDSAFTASGGIGISSYLSILDNRSFVKQFLKTDVILEASDKAQSGKKTNEEFGMWNEEWRSYDAIRIEELAMRNAGEFLIPHSLLATSPRHALYLFIVS